MGKEYKETSMAAVFQNRVAEYGDYACCSYKKDGRYVDLSWNWMNERIHNLAYFLLSKGIKKDDKISIFSQNRYEWWLADLAITSIGAVTVSIYPTNSEHETEHILKDSDSVICFVDSVENCKKVLEVKGSCSNLKDVIIFDKNIEQLSNIIIFEEALKEGSKYNSKEDFDSRLEEIEPEDIATIIYTSGTTGKPKGVMLTHDNFVKDVSLIHKEVKHLKGAQGEDAFLSFLPLSHSLEKTAGMYLAIYFGVKTAFAESIANLLENLKEIRPTVLISVPRIFEKIRAGIFAKVNEASSVKKFIFWSAYKEALKNIPYVCRDEKRSGFFANLAEKQVFSKIRAGIGMDRLKFAISGGGPLSESESKFFIGIGIKILEGYGLTETAPVTNYNRPGKIKPGMVGPPLPETEVKLSEEGELLIKGPQVMKGYYKNPEATKKAFTEDGFFKTEDIAKIDSDGYVKITDRLKDIIITAGGKNIAPQVIESSLKESVYIEQVAVIGDRRKYLSAIVVPEFKALQKWADTHGVVYKDNNDLINNQETNKLFEEEIAAHTTRFSRPEQIRRLTLLDADWTQETGELTPTEKVKRKDIREKYKKEIEAMYPK
jgi:long-chain acyl-CoA synthetase